MRKSIRPQSRRHLWFYDDDYDFIEKFLAPQAGLSPGAWCRELIHLLVAQKREEQQARVEQAHRRALEEHHNG